MADEKDDKNDSVFDNEQNEAQNVADLSIPTIVSALHQTAISKSDAKSKGARITNSAIEEKDGKGKIKSAGEHIVSVLPIDEKKPIEKKVAVELLKTYVQWFVGPDLASKINDSTVKSLTEAPGYEDTSKKPEEKKEEKPEEKKKEKTGDEFNDAEGFNESKKFMSFKQFLKEADEFSDAKGLNDPDDEKTEEPKDEFNSSEGLEDDEDKKTDEKQNDEAKQSKIGYYVPYSLKIEGLPQVALKDAMKKFVKTFFDDVTIKASGLFGGGDSFTVKDIKKSLRNVFGPIDPDELVNSIQNRIEKMYPNTNRPSVSVQDKTTLISDLGKQIDGTQKKMINTADYSLFIKVNEDDPKKPILNTRVVADIVTSSIKGLFKKFKNKITKNDVIFIKGYKDIHEDPKKIRALYAAVPIPDDIYKAMNTTDANKAFSNIEKLLNKIQKDPQRKNVNRALKCSLAWENFKKKTEENNDTPEKREKIVKPDEIKKYFESFIKAYKEAYEKSQDKSIDNALNESLKRLSLDFINANVKNLLIESFVSGVKEKMNKNALTNKLQNESSIKSDIMSILFKNNLDEDEQMLFEYKIDDYIAKNKLSKEDALKPERFKEIKELIHKGDEDAKVAIEKAFNRLKSQENEEQSNVEKISSNDETTIDTTVDADDVPGKQDAYVIPMPGLKYDDPEHENTSL